MPLDKNKKRCQERIYTGIIWEQCVLPRGHKGKHRIKWENQANYETRAYGHGFWRYVTRKEIYIEWIVDDAEYNEAMRDTTRGYSD